MSLFLQFKYPFGGEHGSRAVSYTHLDVYKRQGQYQAGCYPVSANVLFGKDVQALPDGRYSNAPLADGVSPRQGHDVKGPDVYKRQPLNWRLIFFTMRRS